MPGASRRDTLLPNTLLPNTLLPNWTPRHKLTPEKLLWDRQIFATLAPKAFQLDLET
jgi:hypothetical protein